MVIERNPANGEDLIWMYPAPAPLGAQLEVGSSDRVAFLDMGMLSGVVGPGTHTLNPQQLPFLGTSVRGQEIGAELHFLRAQPGPSLRVGGKLSGLTDDSAQVVVSPRYFGELSLLVSDPGRFLSSGLGSDAKSVDKWVQNQFRQVLTKVLVAKPNVFASLHDPALLLDIEAEVSKALNAKLDELGIAAQNLKVQKIDLSAQDRAAITAATSTKGEGNRGDSGRVTPAAAPAPERAAPAASLIAPNSRVSVHMPDGRVFSGVTTNYQNQHYEVAWDGSNTRGWVPAGQVRPAAVAPTAAAPQPGSRVLAQWSDGGFYPAAVRQVTTQALEVQWDNGAVAWLRADQLRPQ